MPRRELAWGDFGLMVARREQIARSALDALRLAVGEALPRAEARLVATDIRSGVGAPEEATPRVQLESAAPFLELAELDANEARQALELARKHLGLAIELCADLELELVEAEHTEKLEL